MSIETNLIKEIGGPNNLLQLFGKYICFVNGCEGTDFIEDGNCHNEKNELSEEEKTTLTIIKTLWEGF